MGKFGFKAMKMSGGAKDMKGMPGMAGAHGDHDAKTGGVLFMAPNEMHHVEGSFDPKCGFQVDLYNAFTKSIHVSRFRAFMHLWNDQSGTMKARISMVMATTRMPR